MSKIVYVLGELNVDVILRGKDITPEPNKEKIVDSMETVLGSSSAITACRLAELGMQVRFVSIVGNDHYGNYCIGRLQQFGIDTSRITKDDNESTGVTYSLSDEKDRSLVTYMGTIPKLHPGLLPEEMFEQADHIHFGSFFLQDDMRPHWASVFSKAKLAGITTSFDTGWDPRENWHQDRISELLAHTDLFIPSEEEVNNIYGVQEMTDLVKALPENRGQVAVKRGSKGSMMIDPDGTTKGADPFKITPVDTTGAGDSFNAGLICAFLEGKSKESMLRFANACGALSTLAVGGTGGEISHQTVERFMSEQGAS